MTFTGKSKDPKIAWRFKVNKDGTLSFSIQATKLRVAEVRGKSHFSILRWQRNLPVPLQLGDSLAQPSVVVVLSAKLDQLQKQRAEWGKLQKLSRKRNK